MENTDNNKAIVFYCKKCNGIIMAVVNNSEHTKYSAREISNAIKQGYQMDIISNEKVRSSNWCSCARED